MIYISIEIKSYVLIYALLFIYIANKALTWGSFLASTHTTTGDIFISIIHGWIKEACNSCNFTCYWYRPTCRESPGYVRIYTYNVCPIRICFTLCNPCIWFKLRRSFYHPEVSWHTCTKKGTRHFVDIGHIPIWYVKS